MEPKRPIDIDNLLSHAHWLRRLALRLVIDGPSADDLMQETWIAALTSPSPRPDTVRGWLRAILRNREARRHRFDSRRKRREERTARPERVEGPAEIVERAEQHRRLVNVVLGLDEPDRTLVLERYFDELSAAEIARRHGLPAATVRSRLRRAMEKLRLQLDEENDGDRKSWQLAFIPLAGVPATSLAAPLGGSAAPFVLGSTLLKGGGILAAKKIAIVLGLALALLLIAKVTILDRSSLGERTSTEPAWNPGTVPPDRDPHSRSMTDNAENGRSPEGIESLAKTEENALAPSEPAAAEASPALAIHVLGEVTDLEGSPVEGVPIVSARIFEKILGYSDAEGQFDLVIHLDPSVHGSTTLVTTGDYATVRTEQVVWNEPEQTCRIVVTNAIDVSGVVVNDDEEPLEGVEVRASVPQRRITTYPRPLDGTTPFLVTAKTDDMGRFELHGIPGTEVGVLEAWLTGYDPEQRTLPPESIEDLELVLTPRTPTEDSIEGIVLHMSGDPAVGATVRFGNDSAVTDDFGRFVLEYSTIRDDTSLVAALPGLQPAVIEGFGGQVKESVSSVVLYLGEASLSITGIVLDAEGEPAVGWRVSLYDPTTVSLGRVPSVSAEQLTSASGRSSVSTDGEGRFRIEGLRDRSYRIQAYHQKSLAMIRSESVPAGTTNFVLRLGRDALSGRVRGQVLSRSGVPLAGVQVTPLLITTRIQNGKSWQSGESTTTDERGNFELEGVPLLEGELSVSGSAVIPQSIEVSPDQDLLTLTLEVAARCHLRIVASGPLAEANRFRILDATDQPLSIYTFDSGGWSSSTTEMLIDGRSPTVAVSEDARILVFQKDQKEIGRIGLRLTPSEVTVITP